MEHVLFVCTHASALAEAAARCFNEHARDRVRAVARAALLPAPDAGTLLVTMGGPWNVAGYAQHVEWSLLDPRSIVPGAEAAHLARLRQHVTALMRERGWLRSTADAQEPAS